MTLKTSKMYPPLKELQEQELAEQEEQGEQEREGTK